MPCFDKKLEASREDFFDQVGQKTLLAVMHPPPFPLLKSKIPLTLVRTVQVHSTRDVDLVLTSAEVIEILAARSIDFNTLTPSPLDSLTSEKAPPPGVGTVHLWTHSLLSSFTSHQHFNSLSLSPCTYLTCPQHLFIVSALPPSHLRVPFAALGHNRILWGVRRRGGHLPDVTAGCPV